MKKLVRKLALSCVALAACALTLVSTTYAWWTTNTEVTADGITGTASTAGDASIFVSLNDVDWAQSVTLDTSSVKNMLPVQMTDATGLGTFKQLDSSKEAVSGSTLTFVIYFKTAVTTDNVNLYISKLTLKNKDTALTPYDNLLYGSTAAIDAPAVGVDRNLSKYAVDIVNSLYMHTVSYPGSEKAAPATFAHPNNLDLQDVATEITSLATGFNDTNTKLIAKDGTTAQAVNYYNEVMGAGKQLGTAPSITYTTLSIATTQRTQIATLPKEGTSVAVAFTVFLNGWDLHCYDAIKTQGFTIDLEFSVTA